MMVLITLITFISLIIYDRVKKKNFRINPYIIAFVIWLIPNILIIFFPSTPLWQSFATPPPSCALSFNLSHYMHGKVCRVASDATAFSLRRPEGVHLVFWVQWKEAADAAASLDWLNKTHELLQQYSSGRIYANYMSSKGESATKSVYGSNYTRLVLVKKKYDPKNIFHLNQNINPK